MGINASRQASNDIRHQSRTVFYKKQNQQKLSELLEPCRMQNQFYSNREQRALHFFNKSFNSDVATEGVEFSRHRPKQFNMKYRKQDDLMISAAQTGIPTAAHFPSIEKDTLFTGHNKFVKEYVPFN